MIDFKEEIAKYAPVRTVDDAKSSNEVLDIMDLLQYLSRKPSSETSPKNQK